MKNKLKVCLILLLSLIVLTSVPSNAISKKNNTNDTITIANTNGQTTTDVYSFTEPYDETAITENGTIKIGEGYTSDGIYYEAFKPATE